MIQNADARPLIPLLLVLTHKKYAYLICQVPPWEDMDAHRGDIQVRVTKSHCSTKERDEVVIKCTETPLKPRQSRNMSENGQNERKYERRQAIGYEKAVHPMKKGNKIREEGRKT